jgi:hypothetical protein
MDTEQRGAIDMSVVIIGGNECMVCQYEEICKKHGCKAKVFVKEKSGFKKKIGSPDLMILFTNTVSHKMVNSAVSEAKRTNTRIARAHSSSASALSNVLQTYLGEM